MGRVGCVCVCGGGVVVYEGRELLWGRGWGGVQKGLWKKKKRSSEGDEEASGCWKGWKHMISAVTGLENDLAPKSFLSCFHQIQICFRFYFSSVTPFFAQWYWRVKADNQLKNPSPETIPQPAAAKTNTTDTNNFTVPDIRQGCTDQNHHHHQNTYFLNCSLQ